MHRDQQIVFESLINEGPESWLAYLRPFEQGEPITGLSMLAIFHYAAPLAKDLRSLEWAEVAARAADLEAANSGGIERENASLSAMQLRSWFISKMGSRQHHTILDKEMILRWVIEGLNLSIDAAKEKASALWKNMAKVKDSSDPANRQLVVEDLRQLRRIKHRLNVVKVLADCGELSNDSVLKEWLEIRQQLP